MSDDRLCGQLNKSFRFILRFRRFSFLPSFMQALCSSRCGYFRHVALVRCPLRRWNMSVSRTRRRSSCTSYHGTAGHISPAALLKPASYHRRDLRNCLVHRSATRCISSRSCNYHRSTLQYLESASRRREISCSSCQCAGLLSRTSLYSRECQSSEHSWKQWRLQHPHVFCWH